MEGSLPSSTVQIASIEASRLPNNSYRNRGMSYARFQPFEVLGDSDSWGNNQLNWTNLFLINNLKGKVKDQTILEELVNIQTLNKEAIERFKDLGLNLDHQYADLRKLISKAKNISDIRKIQAKIHNLLNISLQDRFTKLEQKIEQITKSVDQLTKIFKPPSTNTLEYE